MSGASATFERNGRSAHSGHGDVSPGEIAIGVIIGRTSEFFDFFVYAIASVIVFPKLVFPHLDPLTGTLYSFAIFALAFIARPIGTGVFMAIDRSYGRSVKLTITLFLLGTCTVAIAFLPGYEQIGWVSALLLAVFRTGQGLALGGEWDGLPSLLAMNAPPNRRGWYAMIPQLGAPLGLMVAAALFAYFASNLSSEDFLDWGWRYPFFVAFAINVVALFARLRMVDTPEYVEHFGKRELEPKPISETMRHEGLHVVLGAFTPLASFALFHMVTVFPLSWVFLYTNQSPARFLVIELIGAIVGLITIVLSGYVADLVGRRNLLFATAAVIAVFSGFAPQLLSGGDAGEVAFMVLGFILLGLSFGQSSGTLAENFAKVYRYTGSAFTADLAWLFGAGFAPFVALWLSSHFGLMAAGLYLLSGAVCTLLALGLSRQLQ
ncbi:MFS transporter [Hyphomicrobium sp.]|uniref:MFS transporter n=1 Tax=Hyphomicrobium sp. TaxID=82 RepID=UPI000F96CD27|nr:MFS transporter [Hyphomicrobium sp.]RUO99973.1 MAG: MFS transporter [Hyphomicrobium sp.]